ncbi:MAG: ABC transporter substrate-binding protein [Deltaproteobacteria bacterium]|nr:ABC transporter substrate-binding protein [Deltaproteobacteria bacterium]
MKYDFQNAQGEMANALTIARQFAMDEVDLICAITTPCAQAAVKATNTIPIVVNGVTDPVSAGVIASWDDSGNNVTGVSDMNPFKETIDLYLEILPHLKRLGFLYNAGESNSVYSAEKVKEILTKKGIAFVPTTVSASNEVYMAAQTLADRADAMAYPTDNTISSALESVIKVAIDRKVPFFGMDIRSVERGAVAALGHIEYEIGRSAAGKADQVLKGKRPQDVKFTIGDKFNLYVNLKSAKSMGVEVPDSVIRKAAKVIQ